LNKQTFHDSESIVRKPMNIQTDDFEDDFDYSFEENRSDNDDWDYDESDESDSETY